MPLTVEQLARLRDGAAEPNRLGAAMRLAEVTQVGLAQSVGLTQSHISEIKNGNYRRLPIDTAAKLAGYFGCAIEDLFPSKDAVA